MRRENKKWRTKNMKKNIFLSKWMKTTAFVLLPLFAHSAHAESCRYALMKDSLAVNEGYVILSFHPEDTGELERSLKVPEKFLPLQEGQSSSWIQGSGNPMGENNLMDVKTYRTLNYSNSTLTITATGPMEYRVYTINTDSALKQVSSYKEVNYVFWMPQVELNCDQVHTWP
jgi:hypothetical protein